MGVEADGNDVDLAQVAKRKTFGEIFRQEMEALQPARPMAAGAPASPMDHDRIGLALSGGGIRSAAVALGVLQSLQAKNVFAKIHFLSTVSGGGYTGAALTAALYRQPYPFPFATTQGGADYEPADTADNDAVRSIRDHARYLMPDGRFDLVVSLGILLRGLAVNLVNVSSIVFLCASLALATSPDEKSLHDSLVLMFLRQVSPFSAVRVQSWFGTQLLATKMLMCAFPVWLVVFAIYRSFVGTAARISDRLQSDPGSLPARATGVMILVISTIFLVELQRPIMAKVVEWFGDAASTEATATRIEYVFAAMAAGGVAVGLTFRFFVAALQDAQTESSWSAFFKAATSRLVLYASAAVLPALIYGVFLWLTLLGVSDDGVLKRAPDYLAADWGVGVIWIFLVPNLLVAALVAVQANLGALPNSIFSWPWWRDEAFRTCRFYSAVLCLVGIFALTAVASWLCLSRSVEAFTMPRYAAAWKYAAIGAWLSLVSFFFSENGNSLHRLYRDRLQKAFAIDARTPDAGGPPAGPLKLSDLVNAKPYPIVNATINLGASKKNRRARNADYFIFTPHHVGSDATGYVETKEFEKAEAHLDFATAIAISGAAVSTAMGRVGVAVLAPTLALLNIRLGFWLRNPLYAHSVKARELASRWDWTLYHMGAEAFGLLREDMRKVYVTDGGHIDNLGLHQLLKRRCRFIIVSDAEADPSMVFSALVDAERFARIDLGVRLDLPVAGLRHAVLTRKAALHEDPVAVAVAPADAHATIGTIQYPATTGTNPLPPMEGIILYVKSAMTGDERNYVLDYERRNPKFPHEPTSDQFFSEEQFEAYRALGFHAITSALEIDDGTSRTRTLREQLLKSFEQAR